MSPSKARGSLPQRHEDRLARRGGAVELLRIPAGLFQAVAVARGFAYDRGWLRVAHLGVPVVSVGNLTVGGTGKTPFVLLLARALRARGFRPGLVSRGYRALSEEGGENDEARLLARELPDLPRVQDPDRVRGGVAALAQGADLVVLDDGFQHRRLGRDLDFVLVDATRPWGLPAPPEGGEPVCALLPRGFLREPPRALARADALVVTRADQVEPAERERRLAELAELAPGKPILVAHHRPMRLRQRGGETRLPSALNHREVDLVSALGNPEGFERTVRGLGARVVSHRRFPDHHPYAPGDLDGLGARGRWIVTTEKDATKLTDAVLGVGGPGVHVLGVELALTEGRPVFEALLDALPHGSVRGARESLHEGLHG